jgi:glycosyltransferase involved in cell wall biosynthesis
MSKLSIIVPCYNQALYLNDSIQSVLDQTIADWECIIVNDGSNDNTEPLALAWCKKDSRINYLYKENGGLSSARNAGIAIATGEYILPLDADDKIAPTYAEKAIAILQTQQLIKIVYCNQIRFGDENGTIISTSFDFKYMLGINQIFCSGFYRKSDFLKTNGYSPELSKAGGWEDWDFWLSLLELAEPLFNESVYKIEEPLFYYRIRNNSMSDQIKEEKYITLWNIIFERHKPLYNKYFENPLLLNYRRNLYFSKYNEVLYSRSFKLGAYIVKYFAFLRTFKK